MFNLNTHQGAREPTHPLSGEGKVSSQTQRGVSILLFVRRLMWVRVVTCVSLLADLMEQRLTTISQMPGVSNTFLTYGNMVAMVSTQLFNQRVFRSKSGHGANIIGTYRVGYILAHPVSIGFNPFSLLNAHVHIIVFVAVQCTTTLFQHPSIHTHTHPHTT